MIRTITSKIILLVLLTSVVSFGSELENLFMKANDNYLKGNYEETINIFESIVEKGYEGKSLYYNLGNAYFRAGKLGLAILYYEKAKKLSPADEDINYNLAFANSKIIDNIETLPRFFIFDWWEYILAFLPISGWTYVTYFFYLLTLVSIAYYYITRSLKAQKFAFYGGIAALFLLIISIVLLVVNYNREVNVRFAVITSQEAVTKFSPDQNSKDAFIVHEGLKVRAEDTLNEWTKIKLIDGKVGWVNKDNLKII
jgi:tetratricopeptide (TPR) repeat protein